MVAFAALSAFTWKAISGSFTVDAKASKLVWKGEKVTGFHDGTINISKGKLEIKDDKLVGGSFEIDMNSITCTDLQGEGATKLVGHLKAEDFFGTAKYPTAKLDITKAVWQGKEDYKVTANLTIKDKTNEITFFTKVTIAGKEVKAVSDITVDRTKFDVKYGSGSFFDGLGDKTIYDNFMLKVDLTARQ